MTSGLQVDKHWRIGVVRWEVYIKFKATIGIWCFSRPSYQYLSIQNYINDTFKLTWSHEHQSFIQTLYYRFRNALCNKLKEFSWWHLWLNKPNSLPLYNDDSTLSRNESSSMIKFNQIHTTRTIFFKDTECFLNICHFKFFINKQNCIKLSQNSVLFYMDDKMHF